ncbi:pilin protein [Mitsuokella sp.]|uniref:pilin protein n=1 Tax=Mitsuokella sp. TaxID=2049034 RepID=UPI003D7D5FB9
MLEIVKYLKVRYLNEKGQDLVEYALLLAFVVAVGAVIVGGSDSISDSVSAIFKKAQKILKSANPATTQG